MPVSFNNSAADDFTLSTGLITSPRYPTSSKVESLRVERDLFLPEKVCPPVVKWDHEQTARNRAAKAYKIGVKLEPVAVDAYQEAKAILSRVLNADPKANGVLHNLEDKK